MGTVVYVGNSLKKVSANERRAIDKGMEKLRCMIEQYEHQGQPFEKICNNDTIKYDILGGNFFTFKHQSQQMPLRILYRFKRTKDDFNLEVHMAYIKKYADKRYMKTFAEYVESCAIPA